MRNVRALLSQGVIAVATIAVFGGTARAAVIETQYNPVADNAINTTGGNNDRSDWAAVPSYPADGDDPAAPNDWSSVSVAHDSSSFYFRYATYTTGNFGGFLDSNQLLFIDTDQDRASGFIGGGAQFPTGAEYMIQGSNLYSFAGADDQIAWTWNWVGPVTFDDFPLNDQELSISRASIGDPDAFDFVLLGDVPWPSTDPQDYYPDASNAGAAGDYFTYSTVPVPEPAAMGLAIVGLGWMARRRRA